MNSTTFGQLLEKLLYLSNQKKGTLAKELGYDISYISKWINTKNLPSQKNISEICKTTARFIVSSLSEKSKQGLLDYFEISKEIYNDEVLVQYIERSLKNAYMTTAEVKNINIYKGTRSEDNYNSATHINPSLRKQYLTNDAELFLSKSKKLDMIISANLYHINNDDKRSISVMKQALSELEGDYQVKVRFLMGFDGMNEDSILNTILTINMIIAHPEMDFEIYNCEVESGSILSVIKDNIFHSALFTKDKRCLLTNMSKEKEVVDDMYYSLEDILKNRGKKMFERLNSLSIIRNQIYVQYIMGSDLRWLMGSINELLMPGELFMEIGRQVFGDNTEIIDELQKINLFLQNVTYSSDIKILIYESELRDYISTGKMNFFNIPITLSFEQRERHIEYIERILQESEKINIKLVGGNFVEEFRHNKAPSLYLSKTIKFTKVHPTEDINDYAMIKNNEFGDICSNVFDRLWNERKDVVIEDKCEVIDRISKTRIYAKLINEKFDQTIK
ncbi:hypothetical protein [Faecalimicrobium sp. JNUCC 81]